jgi:flavin reductase (DIM6/NTAB) family NADH-FMN oxidoreductase RutF
VTAQGFSAPSSGGTLVATVFPHNADTNLLRRTFGASASGAAAVAASVDGRPTVFVASSFTVGVSMDPPMVLFAVQNSSKTWPVLARAGAVGISVLGVQHSAFVRQLSGRNADQRLSGLEVIELESHALLIADAPVLMECRVVHDYPAGDHRIIVLEVLATNTNLKHPPLVIHNSLFHAPAPVGPAVSDDQRP